MHVQTHTHQICYESRYSCCEDKCSKTTLEHNPRSMNKNASCENYQLFTIVFQMAVVKSSSEIPRCDRRNFTHLL